MLYIHAGLAVANLLMVVAYLPARPPTPPSTAALLKNEMEDRNTATSQASMGGIGAIVKNGNFWLVAASGGVLNGVFNGWSGSFDQILPPLSPQYTQNACGWLGFGATMAVIVGGVLVSQLVDRPPWNRQMKKLLVIFSVVTTGCMTYVTFALPTAFSATPLLPSNFNAVSALIIVASITIGAGLPLLFEMCAELTYPGAMEYPLQNAFQLLYCDCRNACPRCSLNCTWTLLCRAASGPLTIMGALLPPVLAVSESTSANVIVLILNVGTLVFLGATPPLLEKRALNIVILGT